jgi:predicted ATPase/class 3 adenylate cyclase
MFSLPGYKPSSVLAQRRGLAVVRARRVEDDRPVILKLLVEDDPSLEDLARLRHEYELTRRAAGDSVVTAYELREERGTAALVLEDIGGDSLAHLLAERPLPLETFFDVALHLAQALARLHERRIIHKDINPSNIVLNLKTGQLRLIDFGSASLLPREDQQVSSPNGFEGTLPYMSPEQTGRMNRGVDWRSDLYSLGATFYHLLTQRPPFESRDALELVHCHLARLPVPPHVHVPSLPQVLSLLVLKLLAKTAEERYRGAHGLAVDLAECRQRLLASGSVPEFELGREDLAERFQVPQRLYGREAEVADLLRAFERVSQGPSELLLLKGYAGIGKSALVHEVHKPVTRERGYFAKGKFDQLQRNQPFAALARALSELVRQLLTESDERLAAWRSRLQEALGSNGQVLVDAIPELGLVLGPQPPAAELPPGAAHNRFNQLFLQLVRALASPEHPLVLFLDDLQWADAASLDLLQVLLGDTETRGLLLIGAYRDNEVDASHPLRLALEKLEAAGRCSTLVLGPLDLPTTTRLIQDTASCDEPAARELAELVLQKTQGNPFFLSEFLKSLHEEGCLAFDRSRGAWTWDVERIRKLQITTNVVELMGGKLRKLPESTLGLLRLAACIGGRFDLRMLSLVSGLSPVKAASELWEALQAGLVLPLGDDYRLLLAAAPGAQAPVEAERVHFRFLHDRVQQAAYTLIPQAQRPEVHLRIGRLLLGSGAEVSEEAWFQAVDHLDRAHSLLTSAEERAEVAELNLAAARKAKASTAFAPALAYAEAGLSLLGEQGWATHRELCFRLHVEAMECGYLTGAHERMEALEQVTLAQARTVLEQAEVLELHMKACMARSRMKEAVETVHRILPLLGVSLPSSPGKKDVLAGMLHLRWLIGRRTPQELASLPDMSEPTKLAAMRILATAGHPAQYAAPALLPVLLLRMAALTVQYGNNPQAPFAWTSYGHILNVAFGAASAANTYAQLGLQLLERYPRSAYRAKAEFVAQLVRARLMPWRELEEPLLTAYRHGLETGDLEYGLLAANYYCYSLFASGRELAHVEPELVRFNAAFRKARQERTELNGRLRYQAVLNLMGRGNPQPWVLEGDQFNESQELPRLEAGRDKTGLAQIFLYKTMLGYLFGLADEALEYMARVEPVLDGLNGLIQQPVFFFYQALLLLEVAHQRPRSERRALVRQALRAQARLERWCRHAPANSRHKLSLLEAERAWVEARPLEALEHYEQAINAAREAGFLHEQALAMERAGLFHRSRGNERLALGYLRGARRAWSRWGARAKVYHLDSLHPQLLTAGSDLEHPEQGRPAQATREVSLSTHTTSIHGSHDALELSTVMKATQAISSEIILPRLLQRLLDIVMENAGAERGLLLLSHSEELRVEAGEQVGQTLEQVGKAGQLPVSLVKFVARTREPVVLEEATSEGLFVRDAYVLERRPRSVLCAPLLAQGRLSGVIYLENNLTRGAFTPSRLEMVRMLSAQAAISLENARLYDNLQRALDAQIKLTEAQLRFVPREFLQILQRPSIVEVALGDSVRKEMSILFSDIRGFTTLMEGMSAHEPIEFINSFVRHMEPPITESRGFIDNFIGDAIMALFDHRPEDAVEAGIGMNRRLAVLNAERARAGQAPLKIGVGINTGPVTLGTIGAPQRLKCGVMGDSVNLAARIESLTKAYGAVLLISHHTRSRLEDPSRYALRVVDRVTVKGKTEPVTLYEVLDALGEPVREQRLAALPRFQEATELYYQADLLAAERLFQECLTLSREDTAAATYLARCRQYLQGGLPSEWDGVEHLDHK